MIEEKNILINGLKLNYKVSDVPKGNKMAEKDEPLLILHGWGGASDSWLKIQDILSKQGYKVIAPDLPGFGKTPPPPEPWNRQNYVNLILEFLNKLEITNFFLLGHSFGGSISVMLANQCPERIKKLILCNSAGIKPKPGHRTRLIFLIARIGNAIFTPKHLARFKDTARNAFYIFLRNRDYVKAKGVMRETIKNVFAEDLLPQLSKIKIKTLLIWGNLDKMVPLQYGLIFKEQIADSEIQVIPEIGHSPHIEVPNKLGKIILDFLQK